MQNAHFPYQQTLNELKANNLYRRLRWLESSQGREIVIDGKRLIHFSSNDYLGLSNRQELKDAAIESIRQSGVGIASSRLLSGSHVVHQRLENRLAEFKNQEASLVFPTAYAANLGLLSTVIKKGDLVACDKLNHASMIDGLRLSQASLHFYPHRDCERLEVFLNYPTKGKKWIVTESVFSMDGDIAPLDDLMKLTEKYEAGLIVDDAHGIGVLEATGKGCGERFKLCNHGRFVIVGALSKAIGCLGGFVAGTSDLIEYLINAARGFIFTTALPPHLAQASIKALDIIESEPSLITTLRHNADRLRLGLKKIGFNTLNSETPIIPVVIGDAKTTLAAAEFLLENRVYAPAIRPPTVPENLCRLRFSVTAAHTVADIDEALSVMAKL
jgi:8-amino-7-oxononanoate synthase